MIGALNLMVINQLKLLKMLLAPKKKDLKSEKSSHNLIWFQDQMN